MQVLIFPSPASILRGNCKQHVICLYRDTRESFNNLRWGGIMKKWQKISALYVALALTPYPVMSQAQENEPEEWLLPSAYRESAKAADYEIAHFMQAHCTDQEEAIIYIPRTKKIIPVGIEGDVTTVMRDYDLITKTIRTESNIVEAHCHIMDLGMIAKELGHQDHFSEMLNQLGPREMRKRFLAEIPSAGDVW